MLGPRVNVGAGVDQNKNVKLGREHCRDARPIDSFQGPQLDHARGDGRTGMTSANNRVRLAVLHQIDRTTDRRIFFPSHGRPRAIAHIYHLGRVDDVDPRIVALMLL